MNRNGRQKVESGPGGGLLLATVKYAWNLVPEGIQANFGCEIQALKSNPTIIFEQDLRLLWPSFKLVSLISTRPGHLVLGHPCKYGLLRPSAHNHSLKRGFVWQ